MMMSAGERLIVYSFGILTAEQLPEVVARVKVKPWVEALKQERRNKAKAELVTPLQGLA
jgi:hypothetical protein